MSQATVPLTTSPQQLIVLIRAIAGHANDEGTCTYLVIRGHDTNTSTILEGDSSLSATNYGILLNPGDSRTFTNGKGCNDVSLLNKWLMGSAAGQYADLEWEQT
jgi:hypothetical protein